MKKRFLNIAILSLFVLGFSCKNESAQNNVDETYATGTATVLVEESIVPIFDAINEVFMFTYDKAKVNIDAKTENEIIDLILKDSVKIAVLPRKLSTNELKHFVGKKEVNMTPFAKDAIIFISSKNNKDSIVDVNSIIDLLQNPNKNSEHVVVFDNINSSLVQYFKKRANISEFGTNVYFAKNTSEVVEYVAKNNKAIGVVGINWLLQPDEEIQLASKSIKSLRVLNATDNEYYLPTQSTIADGTYPLIRELYVIEAQGKTGLGRGISNFATSDKGQRIVLKSGLFPIKQPTREIIIKTN